MSKTPQKTEPAPTFRPPLLPDINSPEDLRALPREALPQVCAEIRRLLIDSLSTNPGHFASSMGAVELTVALHYVFDTPYDRLVWDVGHQAYAHKILTGRRDAFAEGNRKADGISGFPSPAESPYDTFAAGHASNSISAALGMAVAGSLHSDEPRRNVVAIIGDASISGGLAFEGINNAANTPNNLLIVLNDNDMSIDRNVGSLNSYLAHLTTSRGYNDVRHKLYKVLRRHEIVDERRRGAVLRFGNSLKSLITSQQNIFEGLNIRYFGPFDGHDIDTIVRVLRDIKDMEGPRILHLRTIKGKGYAPAEADPAKWHAPGLFDPKTGVRAEDLKTQSSHTPAPVKYQDVFGHTLLELARQNKEIVAITAAMPSGTSVSIMQAEIPERTFDVGISEGHAVTFAGGLAKDGMRPFVAIYSSFLQRGYDHIIHDVALNHLPVTFCIDRAGLVGEDGATHHGAFDLAYLRTVPGMIVAAPRDEHWLRNLMYTAQADNHGPMAIRYPRGKGHNPDWHNDMHSVEIGRAERLTAPDDAVVAVISIGPLGRDVAKAVETLDAEGIKVLHYDAVFLKPLDQDMLRDVTDRHIPVVTVEDGTLKGGLGSAVAEWMADNRRIRPLTRLGLPDEFIPQGTPAQLYRKVGLDPESITNAIRRAAEEGDEK